MSENDINLNVHKPSGRIDKAPRIPASPRLDNINGKKIGVLKLGVWGVTEKLWPILKDTLTKQLPDVEFSESSFMAPAPREERLKEITEYSGDVINALTHTPSIEPEETSEDELVFSSSAYPKTMSSMEKYFLQHGCGDCLPLISPTREVAEEILEGTELSPDHSIGLGHRPGVDDMKNLGSPLVK